MEKKRLFDPGQLVATFGGMTGLVMDREMYGRARKTLPEGRKAGRYFAPGCCQSPDYVTQVPVLFEDGMWDVMRPMNIKKKPDTADEKRAMLQRIIQENI